LLKKLSLLYKVESVQYLYCEDRYKGHGDTHVRGAESMHQWYNDTYSNGEEMWAQRGHSRCASTGTDACVGGTVEARVKRVIDSRGGEGEHSLHGILPQSWYQRVIQLKTMSRSKERRSWCKGEGGRIDSVKKK
jgi:hypothetical protein